MREQLSTLFGPWHADPPPDDDTDTQTGDGSKGGRDDKVDPKKKT